MRKTIVLAAVVAAASMLSGCAGFAFMNRGVAGGLIYSETSANEQVTEAGLGTKRGESCATSILGWVTTGDASVATAAKNAGITKVGAVDHQYNDILGVYAKYCVIVSGD